MKKATVIVIAAIYVASIVVVGTLGLKSLIYSETVFVEEIVFDNTFGGAELKPTSDGNGYRVTMDYVNGLTVPISFFPVPSDATYRNDISMEKVYDSGGEDNPCATLTDNGVLIFHKKGVVRVRVYSIDGRKVSRELRITAI